MEAPTALTAPPDLTERRQIDLKDLTRLDEPVVIFEGNRQREGEPICWIYTIAGWLDGMNVATKEGGCTVGGDAIAVFAETRAEADFLAVSGMDSTIDLVRQQAAREVAALHSAARLAAAGPLGRLNLAMSGDNPEFHKDVALLRAAGFGDAVSPDVYRTGNRRH